MKAGLREKLLAINVPIRKEERSQISNLNFHLKDMEEGNLNPKQANRRK